MVKATLVPTRSPAVTRWPTTMPDLKASHFAHGTWSGTFHEGPSKSFHLDLIAIEADNLAESTVSKALKNLTECGTPRCAVGNVMAAFGQDPRYGAWNASPLEDQVAYNQGPVALFVRTFAKHLGFEGQVSTLFDLSHIFEMSKYTGPALNRRRRHVISAKKAADAWSKTITELGYTEAV